MLLSRIDEPWVWVSSLGRVREATRGFEKLLAGTPGLLLDAQGFLCVRLDGKLRCVVNCPRGEEFIIDTPLDQMEVLTGRLEVQEGDSIERPAGFVLRLQRHPPRTVAELKHVWRFTRMEAHVFLWYARGLCPKEIAAKLGIGLATVRSHMKGIYRHTQTSTIEEVFARVLRPRDFEARAARESGELFSR